MTMSDTEPTSPEPNETPTTITLPDSEPANDNSSDDGSPAATGESTVTQEQRASRKERQANKYREAQERERTANARLAERDAEVRRMSDQIAELRGRTAEIQRSQQQTAENPHDKMVSQLEEIAERHLEAAAAATKPEIAKAEMREYHKALRQAAIVEARRDMQGEFERFGRSQPDPEAAAARMALGEQFPWIRENDQARAMTDGYINVLVAKGRPRTLATFREACTMVAKDLGLGGAETERPTETRRAAYTGVSNREGGGDDGRTQLQVPADDVPKLKQMARHMFPQLGETEAWTKWLKDVAPKSMRK